MGLETLTRELAQWLAALVDGMPCEVLGADAPHPKEGIALRLVSAEPLATMHNAAIAPLTLSVRYLVSVSSPEVLTAHRAYGEVLFAALRRADIELAPMDAAVAALRSFNLEPVPGLMFDARLARSRSRTDAPPVRELVVVASDMNDAQDTAKPRKRPS
jgi:hypothetical protein